MGGAHGCVRGGARRCAAAVLRGVARKRAREGDRRAGTRGWLAAGHCKDAYRVFRNTEGESDAMSLAVLLETSFSILSLFLHIHSDLQNLLEMFLVSFNISN